MTIAEQFRKYKSDTEIILLDRYNKKLSQVSNADHIIKAFDDKKKPLEFVNDIALRLKLTPNPN
jgi:hypothetical protein